jgi:outer membrane receptor protein involved in Fe transport
VSYFVHALGTHTFKGGYFWSQQGNDVLRNYNGGAVSLNWGTSYAPVSSTTACDTVKSQNLALYGNSVCQGRYGYFIVGTGVINTGGTTQTAQALYFQDSWQVMKRLTLNVGLRFDTENQPPTIRIASPH